MRTIDTQKFSSFYPHSSFNYQNKQRHDIRQAQKPTTDQQHTDLQNAKSSTVWIKPFSSKIVYTVHTEEKEYQT